MLKRYLLSLIEKSYKQNSDNILDLLESQPHAKILDLGCDDGIWTKKLAERIGTDNVYGVEVVEERIKTAEDNGIQVRKSDLNKDLSFENSFFDVVHSNQVIEHLHNTDKFISEIYRVLKPNGYAVISTENLSSWHNVFALTLGFQPFSSSNYSAKGNIGNPFALWNNTKNMISSHDSWQHNRLFSYYALKDIFRKHGFFVETVLTSGYYPLWGKISKIDPIHGHWIAIKVRKES